MTAAYRTLPVDGTGAAPTRRTGTHRTGWRRPGPLALAVTAAIVLCVLGVTFALIPLLRGTPGADALPASSARPAQATAPAAAATHPAASGSASALPSVLRTLPPVTGGRPTSRPADLENQLIALTNQARSRVGCRPVKNDGHLRSAARDHSNDMARRGAVSHAGSDGSSFADRIRKAGYRRPLSENVGERYQTAQQAITAWLADAQQRANILNCGATAVGVGVTVAKNGIAYWTQDFGN